MQNSKIKNHFIITVIASFFFLWGLPATIKVDFDTRIIIFLLSPFIIIKIIEDWKLKRFNFFFLFFFVLLFLTFHGLLNANVSLKFFLSIFFLLYLFAAMYYYHDLVLEYKKYLIFFFIFSFFISIFITFLSGYSINPEPFSCGAIKNYLPGHHDINSNYYFLHFISSYEFLFQENSHFAMVAVPVILSSLFLISKKKISIPMCVIVFIFIIVSILKISATLILGLLVSSLILILFEYKRIHYFLIITLLLFSLILGFIFSRDIICLQKIYPKFQKISILDKQNSLQRNLFLKINQNFNTNFFIKKTTDQNEDNEEMTGKKKSTTGSLSAAVFFHALNISIYSFLERPFGWGFQGYENAFLTYNLNNPNIPIVELYKFNSNDGTNNFFKIITEFGIFGFVLYLIMAFSLISKKISLENKFFLFPFLITQSLRGVGYFNAGFILVLLILLFLQFKTTKKQ